MSLRAHVVHKTLVPRRAATPELEAWPWWLAEVAVDGCRHMKQVGLSLPRCWCQVGGWWPHFSCAPELSLRRARPLAVCGLCVELLRLRLVVRVSCWYPTRMVWLAVTVMM